MPASCSLDSFKANANPGILSTFDAHADIFTSTYHELLQLYWGGHLAAREGRAPAPTALARGRHPAAILGCTALGWRGCSNDCGFAAPLHDSACFQ